MVTTAYFGVDQMKEMCSLNRLEILSIVCGKFSELENGNCSIEMPMSEKKPLPIDQHFKRRTHSKPRSTPIDAAALFPCLHQKRNQEQQQDNVSLVGNDGLLRKSKRLKRSDDHPQLHFEPKKKISDQLGGWCLPFAAQKSLTTKSRSRSKPRSALIDAVALFPCLYQELHSSAESNQKRIRLPPERKGGHGKRDEAESSRNGNGLKCAVHRPEIRAPNQEYHSSDELRLSQTPKRIRLPSERKRVNRCCDEAESSRNSRRTKEIREPTQLELPREYKQKISELGGCDSTLVIERTLRNSDLRRDLSRLNMPWLQCRIQFGNVGQRQVNVIQPCNNLRQMTLTFNKWDSLRSYVFQGSWNEFVAANNLEKGDVIQVWSFKQRGELTFAVVKLN